MLISNTGRPVLAHCRDAITDFLGDRRSAAFVTAASLADEARYFEEANDSLVGTGTAGVLDELVHLKWDASDAHARLEQTQAVIVGGGNTFALLSRLRESGLLDSLRDRVLGGLPYIGSSAGANIAGPNVLTSNDWNVVSLTRFSALGLTGFNINPHYVVRDASASYEGETRDWRVGEYHLIWDNPVVALEEGAILRLEDDKIDVSGSAAAKVFTRAQPAQWFAPGSDISAIGHAVASSA